MRSGAAAAGDVEAAWTGDETRALIRQYVERTFKRAGS